MDKLDIIYFQVGKKPVLKTINNDIQDMNELVGGYIETAPLSRENMDLLVICDEEGKLKNKITQMDLGYTTIAGDFFITRFDGHEDYIDIKEGDMDYIEQALNIKIEKE